MSLDYYDRNETFIAYTNDGEHIFTFSGRPVAYLYGNSVYPYQGRHLGLVANKIVRDNQGRIAFFTDGASFGFSSPMLRMKLLTGLKQLRPLKRLRQLKLLKPLNVYSWSPLSGQQFFAYFFPALFAQGCAEAD